MTTTSEFEHYFVVEPQTGIPFPTTLNELTFVGCGVRTKLLIKVYAIGTYIDEKILQSLNGKNYTNKDENDDDVQKLLCDPKIMPRTFRIVTYWTIPSSMLTMGIVDSIRPRLENKKTEEEMKDFESLLYEVMPQGDVLPSGSEFVMVVDDDTFTLMNVKNHGDDDNDKGNDKDNDNDQEKIENGLGNDNDNIKDVNSNNHVHGKNIRDKDFCDALCDVYFGNESVSYDHKESVVKYLRKILDADSDENEIPVAVS